MLARFILIVATDVHGGISKNGTMPWKSRADMKFFREKTTGNHKNAVIMGRRTYESIPTEHRPLQGRHNIVISRQWRQEDHSEISVYSSIIDALGGVGSMISKYEEIYVIGGESIYRQIVKDYLYLCDKIYVTKFKVNYNCDQFFPLDNVKNFEQGQNPVKTKDYTRFLYVPNVSHPEYNYLDLLRKIHDDGEFRNDRTGVGTISLFGQRAEYDISERIPILTTKKVNFNHTIVELLWFISGSTDSKILENQGVYFWRDNTSEEFLKTRELKYVEGDTGPLYGFQWRHWGAEYKGCDADYSGKGKDQLTTLIENLQKDPFSRRHIISTWNVSDLDKMVLPPCHSFVQFYVSPDRKYLDCCLYQRSYDAACGAPHNILSYSILTYMIAHITGYKPRKFIHMAGDAHIYKNHLGGVDRQLGRTPHPWPKLVLSADDIRSIDDFKFEHFQIKGYTSWPYISYKMAV